MKNNLGKAALLRYLDTKVEGLVYQTFIVLSPGATKSYVVIPAKAGIHGALKSMDSAMASLRARLSPE